MTAEELRENLFPGLPRVLAAMRELEISIERDLMGCQETLARATASLDRFLAFAEKFEASS